MSSSPRTPGRCPKSAERGSVRGRQMEISPPRCHKRERPEPQPSPGWAGEPGHIRAPGGGRGRAHQPSARHAAAQSKPIARARCTPHPLCGRHGTGLKHDLAEITNTYKIFYCTNSSFNNAENGFSPQQLIFFSASSVPEMSRERRAPVATPRQPKRPRRTGDRALEQRSASTAQGDSRLEASLRTRM